MELGYIGLGAMGGALARRLMLTHKLHVYDRNAGAMADFATHGAVAAKSPADLATTCDAIFICVPRSSDVREIVYGEMGLAQGLTAGKIVVDQTSGDPTVTRSIASDLKAKHIAFVDAPVSGGPQGAAAGTIAIMVGGAREHYERIAPILRSISPNVAHCGEIGSGQVLKLINNTISTCNRFATLEAVALGLKNGLSLATMTEVLNSGGARSRVTENLLPAIVKGERRTNFALALMLKDLNLATQLATESGAPMHFGHLARSLLQVASNAFGPNANLDEIVNLVGSQAGAELKA
jgi:3-hydroxyisobutyrate dehydrogenase